MEHYSAAAMADILHRAAMVYLGSNQPTVYGNGGM